MAERSTRRAFLGRAGMVAAGCALVGSTDGEAATSAVLDVAYAGSMGSVMSGPLTQAASKTLGLEIHGHGQGASALAQLIVGGSLTPDVFLPITASPMLAVLRAGKATEARAVARTEMVIAYSPRSRFAPKLDAAAKGNGRWWEVLQEPGLRFGRTDPAADPQGRNILFTMMLAAKLYQQPRLVEAITGPTINPQQISLEPNLLARLQSGELDAASSYAMQPSAFHLPAIRLPKEINLSGERVHLEHPEVQLTVGGKTYVPEPLVYYAAVLNGARNPSGAAAFVQWLRGSEAQAILRQAQYEAPGDAAVLRA